MSISDCDNHLSALMPCSHSVYQSKNASSDFNSICKINITCKTANGRGCGPFEHIRLLTATFHLPSSNRVLHLGKGRFEEEKNEFAFKLHNQTQWERITGAGCERERTRNENKKNWTVVLIPPVNSNSKLMMCSHFAL